MGSYDEVPDILEPYDPQFKIWECEGKTYAQHNLVPDVGRAGTYSVVLAAPREAPVRFMTVQDNRITNLMAHQPVPDASVFDKWGKYLGQGGGPLDPPGPSAVEEAVSMVELAKRNGPFADSPRMEKLRGVPMPGVHTEHLRPEPEQVAVDEMVELARPFQEPPPEGEVDCHLHRFWLRGDLEVKVKLPLDLTDEEAERFAVFVTTLPLSSKIDP